eukprot:6122978-Amphidinium_carterae.2
MPQKAGMHQSHFTASDSSTISLVRKFRWLTDHNRNLLASLVAGPLPSTVQRGDTCKAQNNIAKKRPFCIGSSSTREPNEPEKILGKLELLQEESTPHQRQKVRGYNNSTKGTKEWNNSDTFPLVDAFSAQAGASHTQVSYLMVVSRNLGTCSQSPKVSESYKPDSVNEQGLNTNT